MTVTGKVWFGPSAKDDELYKLLELILKVANLPFPATRADAIQIGLHRVGDPNEASISVRSGINHGFANPAFATHGDQAWAVANVAVQIGPIQPRYNVMVDDFNAMVMAIFNLASGNLLTEGNVLTWNIWLNAPTIVDRAEWAEHGEVWRHSIDTGHGSPDGPGSAPRHFDGRPFSPLATALEEPERELSKAFMTKHAAWVADVAA